MSGKWLSVDITRYISHFGLVLFTLFGCILAHFYAPEQQLHEVLAFGLAYVALILLAATLLIGPFNYLRKRRNPVNLNLRRDIGIWSGITGIFHVVFGLQIYAHGDVLFYFFTKEPDGYKPLLNLFGLSNYVGALATLLLFVLLVTSNNLSLRWLKGKRWKFIQRFNYLLFPLVLAHTFGYQLFSDRELVFILAVFALMMLVVLTQAVGVDVYRTRREASAAVANNLPSRSPVAVNVALPPKLNEQSRKVTMARKQFLALGGATFLTGMVTALALDNLLFGRNPEVNQGQGGGAVSQVLPTDTDPQTDNAGPTSSNSITNTDSTTSTPVTASPTVSKPGATSTDTPTAANSGGTAKILTTLAALPVGNATPFTTPDTNENAFLIHEADGSIKAFSSICTHRPYDLVYNQGQRAFICPLHRAYFDLNTGAATRGPTRVGLKKFDVQVDNKGNVVYVQA